MSRPTARVLALLELLQSGRQRTVAELAERLGVDERTVRRYVEHLVDLEIPVQSVRGRYGGYRLAPGYRMPPLMLSEDEAVAVAFGLLAAGRTGAGPVSAVESAAAKLRRVLPDGLARRLEILLGELPPAAEQTADVRTRALLLFAAAIRDRRTVSFDYTDRTGRVGSRTVSPYGVVDRSQRWYLVGWDEERSQVRNFRLDRVTRPAVTDRRYVSAPDGLDPAVALSAGLAATPWRHEVIVLLDGAELPDDVVDLFPPGAVAAGAGDRLRVTFRVERLDWVPVFLLGLDLPFVIEAPAELCALSRLFARRLDEATRAIERAD